MTPSEPPRLPADFLDFVDKRLAGIITPEEQARLEWHLAHTPGATAHYLALAATEAWLPDVLALRGSAAVPAVPPGFFRRRNMVAFAAASAAAAAMVVTTFVVFAKNSGPVTVVASGVPAKVTRSVGARWVTGTVKPGARLPDAKGEIDAGFVELTMDSGVRLVIEGPAAFRVTGPNALSLAYGKAVADVPPNARGFTLDGPGERIIDHGTRFAVEASRDGGLTTVGVLSGEIEVKRGARDVRLYTDYALRRSGDELDSVPFERRRFTTEMPAREFDWSLDTNAGDKPVELRFNVTRLVHGAGDYRAVFKWLLGTEGVAIRHVALLCDGTPVVSAEVTGVAGKAAKTTGNATVLHVGETDFKPGRWELTMTVARPAATASSAPSRGILTLEDGLSLNAKAADFRGSWKYSHNGDEYVREFGADGLLRMTINGKPYVSGSPYTVKDGILSVTPGGLSYPELHMLRDDGTLVFLNLPYRNAHRD